MQIPQVPINQVGNEFEIFVNQDSVVICNLEFLDQIPSEQAIKIIIHRVANVDLEGLTENKISELFFANDLVIKRRSNNGIVETPNSMARFIVTQAFERWKAANPDSKTPYNHLNWLDPCSGAGIFPQEIINFYFDRLNAKAVSELPNIIVCDLFPLSIISTLLSLRLVLERRGVSFTNFLNEEKLVVYLGDTLSIFTSIHDIFSKHTLFDIVVGNPPYVRSLKLSIDYKKMLSCFFTDAYDGSADLYMHFIVSGVSNLKDNGVLSFISPAAFTRVRSGQALRQWLARNVSVDTYIDLDETRVFSDASLHAAIYSLVKNKTQTNLVNYLHVANISDLDRMYSGLLSTESVAFERSKLHGWAFHQSEKSLQVFSNLFSKAKSLQDLGVNVYSGIRPGLSKVYIIDEDLYESFSEETKRKWFRKTVLPAHIKRWFGAKKYYYFLIIPSGTKQVDSDLLEYLLPFKDSLTSRSESKNRSDWFALRPCSYYAKMDQRKIAFPDLSAQQRFSLVEKGIYIPDGAYFVDTDNLVLLGILNSAIAREYFIKRCSSVGSLTSKGRFRFKKTFVQNFPVPVAYLETGPTQKSITLLVQKMIDFGETEDDKKELDKLVESLYLEAK